MSNCNRHHRAKITHINTLALDKLPLAGDHGDPIWQINGEEKSTWRWSTLMRSVAAAQASRCWLLCRDLIGFAPYSHIPAMGKGTEGAITGFPLAPGHGNALTAKRHSHTMTSVSKHPPLIYLTLYSEFICQDYSFETVGFATEKRQYQTLSTNKIIWWTNILRIILIVYVSKFRIYIYIYILYFFTSKEYCTDELPFSSLNPHSQ